jgi:hypothetical protein
MCVYGKASSGKTSFASTLPKPILLLDVQEHGTETIRLIDGIDIRTLESWDEFEQGYWYLKNNDTKYKSIVVDQITQLQQLAMAKLRDETKMDPTDTFSRRDWGQVSGQLQTWLLNYRDLWNKYHICFIAHERSNLGEESPEDQIDPSIGPRVMPSVASFLTGAVSFIGNTFIRERFLHAEQGKKIRQVEYCMRIGPHAYYVTKTRRPYEIGGEIPDSIVNPTFEKILAIARGEEIKPKKVARRSA